MKKQSSRRNSVQYDFSWSVYKYVKHSLYFWALVPTYDLLKTVRNMLTSICEINYSEGYFKYPDFWHFKILWEIREKTAAN